MAYVKGFLQLIAYGDAYGAPYEESDHGLEERLREEAKSGQRRAFVTRDSDLPLKWTDDTAMNLAVGRAMLGPRGYTTDGVLLEYAAALKDPLVSGWGRIVPAALAAGKGIQNTRRNGALMRTPMVMASYVYSEGYSDRILKGYSPGVHVANDAALTHDSEVCVAASVAYGVVLDAFLGGRCDDFLSMVFLTEDVGPRLRQELMLRVADRSAMVEVFDAFRDACRWLHSSPSAVLTEVRANPEIATGDVVATLATSLWLGMRAASSCWMGLELNKTLDLGIAIGGDVDTRLALAAPFALPFFDEGDVMPNFSKIERYEEILALEEQISKRKTTRAA